MDRRLSQNQMATERLTRLLFKHRQMLLAYVYTLVLDHHKAEDVLQETAVTLIRRAQDYGEVGDFWSLAREIARRNALALLRKEGPWPAHLTEEVVAAIDGGFSQIERDQIWDESILHRCIQKLPPLWQQVIRNRYWQNLRVNQIATDLDRSASTISVTLNRARLRLADCMARYRGREAFE